MPPHFRTAWLDSYTKSFSNLGKNQLRASRQYLTGHSELNHFLNKYKPQSISQICPHFSMEAPHYSMEIGAMNQLIGQCPIWFYRKKRFLNCYYISVSVIANNFPLRIVVEYICFTNRFNQL